MSFVRLRLAFRSSATLKLPPHAGFAWRGAFGSALKRTVCAMRLRPCEGCMLSASCLYPHVFETAPPESAKKMTLYDRVPNPFVLYAGPVAEQIVAEGDTVLLVLTVFGTAARHVPYLLRAFEVAGETGLTSRKVALQLTRVDPLPLEPSTPAEPIYRPGTPVRLPQPLNPLAPPAPERPVFEFVTPLRIKENNALVTPGDFSARHLIASLIRRLSMLMYFHGSEALTADFAALKAAARAVPVFDRQLRWLDLTRKSSRQDTLMQMGGLVGRIGIDLRGAAHLWPYLWLGQFAHAGKGTTMGLGYYRIVDAADAGDGTVDAPG